MNLVVLSHLEPILCGEWYYLFHCQLWYFSKHTIMLHNKPTTIAQSSTCCSV